MLAKSFGAAPQDAPRGIATAKLFCIAAAVAVSASLPASAFSAPLSSNLIPYTAADHNDICSLRFSGAPSLPMHSMSPSHGT